MRISLLPTWLIDYEKEAKYTMKKHGSFTTPLVVSPLPSGRRWKLFLPFTYHIGSKQSNKIIKVPAGFLTDFASVPKMFWGLFPPWCTYGKATVLHDFMYARQTTTRKYADDIFREAMVVLEVPRWRLFIVYWSVRIFGWISWSGHQRRQSNAKPK